MSRTRSRATRRTRTPQLEVQWVAPADLVPDPANPRTMDAAEDSKLDRSLTELGFRIPILARHADRVVIDGHQRLRAALRLGLEAIPVLFVDDLDEAQARLLNLAINNIHGRWDDGMLARLMADLQAEPDADLAVAGFDEAHVRDLLRSLDTRERRHRVETFDVAAAIEEAQQGKEKIKPGDLWQLGPHRLICGDATDAAAVERLLDGGRGMMAFQDPPYNVALGDHGGQQRGQRRRRLANDALPPAAWQDFCRAWARHTLEAVDGAIYVCMSSKEWPSVCSALSEAGGHWSDTIVWRKDRHVLGRADYQRAYEPIWYGWREGAKRHWCGDRDQADVWEIPRAAVNAAHPTQKPLALVERAIENSSRPADLVVDLFLGSGTTLLAAERTGRICAGLELDPHYCDVVIARWEAFTGAKAERVEAGRPPRKERTAS